MSTTSFFQLAAGFIALTFIAYLLLYRMVNRGIAQTDWSDDRKRSIRQRFLLGILLWPAFLLIVSATGFFEDFTSFPPRIMIVLGLPLVIVLWAVFSNPMKELLPLIPARSLIRLQFFRVFVELLIWAAFVQNQLPIQMTFEGRNLDVISGLLAPFVAYFFATSRKVQYLYNFMGLALLINIVTIAILSLPTPFRYFMNEPANVLVARFPFILLPGMLVPLAYGLHFLSLRQLGLKN